MCFLVGTLPNGQPFRHELLASRTTIGRFAMSSLRVDHPSISPLHAELISLGHQRFLVRDLHSQTGVEVNGEEVFEEEICGPCSLKFGAFECDLVAEATVSANLPTIGKEKALGSVASPAHKARKPTGAPLQITLPKPRLVKAAAVAATIARRPIEHSPSVLEAFELTAAGTTRKAVAPATTPVNAFCSPQRSFSRPAKRVAVFLALLGFCIGAAFYVGAKRGERMGALQQKERNTTFIAHVHPAPLLTLASTSEPNFKVRPASSAADEGAQVSAETRPLQTATVPESGDRMDELPQAGATPDAQELQAPAPLQIASDEPTVADRLAASASGTDVDGLGAKEFATTPEIAPPNQGAETTPPGLHESTPTKKEELVSNSEPKQQEGSPSNLIQEVPQPGSPEAEDAGELVATSIVKEVNLPETAGDTPSGSPETIAASRNEWSFHSGRSITWDVSAGALLASNEWAGGKPDATGFPSLQASTRGAPWEFNSRSSQASDAVGDLARLTRAIPSPSLVAPSHPAPPAAPAKISVMILGDSLALCGFGSKLDHLFRKSENIRATNTYMACGTVPMSWLKDAPFTNLRTYCGFWSIEEPVAGAKKPLNFQDTYGTGHGKPKPHPVPKLEDLLARAKPEILVLQTGTNLYSLFPDAKTVQPERHAALLKAQLQPFLQKLLKSPDAPRAIYWVASPVSGRVAPAVQDFVLEQVRSRVEPMAKVIDSRTMISYPYKHPEPDKEHFMGEEMDQWAEGVYKIIQNDLSTQGLPVALARPASLTAEKVVHAPATVAQSPAPALRVTAKLVSISKPMDLQQLHPYQESMVGCLYDVEKVDAGLYEEKQIMVMHPAHIGKKLQGSLAKLKAGKTYQMQLRELDDSVWRFVKRSEIPGYMNLLPYLRVEDEARFPADSQ